MAVTVRPGRNVWLLARTDRDAPSPETAAQTGAAWLNRILTGETILPISSPRGPAGVQRYYLGAARPFDVVAMQERPPMPAPDASGTALATSWRWRHEEQPEPFAVKASKVWYVLADFDWRGPVTEIDPWPHRAVNALGIPTDRTYDLDWLLIEARHLGPATRPDGDWTGDVATSATAVAKEAAGWGTIATFLVVAYVLGAFGSRR